MAQTRRKRTRKHRGNAAGIIERPAHNSRNTGTDAKGRRPTSGGDARAERLRKRQERFSRPPTWKGAVQRASVAAALFAVLIMVVFKEKPTASVSLALFMLVVYVPLSYLTDRALYNWRKKKGMIPPS
jgi:hypothetical protein